MEQCSISISFLYICKKTMNINITKYITIIFFSLSFLDADSQTRYLDNIFTDIKITEIDTFAINVSIEPMLFGSSPALMPI